MKNKASASVAAIAAATLAVGFVAPAGAQSPPVTSTPVATVNAEDQGIADIIVTASRRETTLQTTAIPVTAITGETLAARGVTNVQALTNLAPSLKVAEAGGGALLVTTRGVGNLGANNFNEPGVSINFDGAYLARSFSANGIFFDVARVELLKGPQGTLYGRNTTGGVLNIITNEPTDEFGGALTVEAGNYGLLRASGAINIPIAQGVAVRVAGQGVDRDGYLSDGYNDDKGYAGRVKLKLDPTPDLSISLQANFSANKGQGVAFVFSPFVDRNDPYVGPSDPRSNAIIAAVPGLGAVLPKITPNGFLDNKSRGLQGTIDYAFAGMKATLIVANQRNTLHYLQYSPAFPVADDTRDDPNYYSTAELRLASNGTGPFKWVVGGFYFKDDFTTNVFVNQGFTFADSRDLTIRNDSYSGFGEATYAVIPTVRVTAGGRYTSDEKSIDGITLNPPVPCLSPSAPVVDPVRGSVCRTADIGAKTFSKFTYKVGIDADLGPSSLVYGTYATGFKAGGFFASANFNPPGTSPSNAYLPETISAFTVGSKNRFLDNTLQVNAEAFYWKYKDKQVSRLGFVPPNNQILLVDNAGDATVYGAEIDIVWQPTRNDDFGVTLQYLHTNYDEFSFTALVPAFARPFAPGSPVPRPLTGCNFGPTIGINGAPRGTGVPGQSIIDCSGRPISLAPTWSANLSYLHIFELPGGSSLIPAITTQIQSGFFVGEEYFAGQYQESYTRTDASLTWNSAQKRYSITAYVNNIEDEAVAQTATLQGTIGRALVSLRPPRTWGVRAGVQF